MNEASATKNLLNLLEDNDFFAQKIADRSTIGLPDGFLAKSKKGMFIEIKFIEFSGEEFPVFFNQWSAVVGGKLESQFMTMYRLNYLFLSRYIIIYRNKKNNESRFALISPSTLKIHRQKRTPVPIFCRKIENLINELHTVLQI